VLGVLVEKAKTTPDQYPMSLNGLTVGCNQKSNRSPLMDLEQERVEDALEHLRRAGAVGEVQGSGRVPKYRHYCKDWLGVDGCELAVMAELLLRGPQTVGDLRGRAARMASGQLPDLSALKPVLDALIDKKLVIPLTPEGRGQIVSHNLFLPDELARVTKEHGGGGVAQAAPAPAAPRPAPSVPAPTANQVPIGNVPPSSHGASSASAPGATSDDGTVAALRSEVATLRDEVARLRKEVEDLWASLS
jgi:uncharacterized protein YceH (UPF0502 family)